MLAVRMMAAKLDWLTWPVCYQQEGLVWRGPDTDFIPSPADLASAQRALYKIRKYPVAGGQAFGKLHDWLRTRTALLDSAKRLSALSLESDARSFVDLSSVTLLEAEAVCRSRLPFSPVKCAVAAGESALPLLAACAGNRTLQMPVRALSALVAGVIARTASVVPIIEPHLRQAYLFGQRYGLPADPGLAANLLCLHGDDESRNRILSTVGAQGRFGPSRETIMELIARGSTLQSLVELADSYSEANGLVDRIVRRREELLEIPKTQRMKAAERFQSESEEALNALGECFDHVARSTGSGRAIRSAVRFVELQLPFRPYGMDLGPGLTWPLRLALSFTPSLQAEFLSLLLERHSQIWSLETQPKRTRRNPTSVLGPWLTEKFHRDVRLLSSLLQKTGDSDVVRAAIDLHLEGWIGTIDWPDRECLAAAIALGETVELNNERSVCENLAACCRAFPRPAGIFPLIRRLLAPCDGWSPTQKAHLLAVLLESARDEPKRTLKRLTALLRFVPIIAELSPGEGHSPCPCYSLASAFLTLSEQTPGDLDRRFRWVMDLLTTSPGFRKRTWDKMVALEVGIQLACLLAPNDELEFHALVEACVKQKIQRSEALAEGIKLLARIPTVHGAFARVFSEQPLRCTDILERMGLISRLGPECSAPIREFASRPESDLMALTAWGPILDAAPHLVQEARRYAEAALLLERNPGPSSGIARAAGFPQKLERQVAHLNARIARGEADREVLERRDRLAARLADSDGLRDSVVHDLSERLTRAADLLQMEALDRKIADCYAIRLAPFMNQREHPLDDGLMQAAILAANVQTNKKPLKRLLRAYFDGDAGWRERHPANSRFLSDLKGRGIDPGKWLGRNPRRVRLKDIGAIRIYMENEPLHILPMGSYFKTCLSVNQFNAFSAVANACDLNKRVIYARDAGDRVVGRKLIAITDTWQMVGFYTYTGLAAKKQNSRLRRAIRRYCLAFATECGIEPADSGDVPRLMAEDWYDDGVVPWTAANKLRGDSAKSTSAMTERSSGKGSRAQFRTGTRQQLLDK